MCLVAGVKIPAKRATEKKIQFGNTTYMRINVGVVATVGTGEGG